MSDQTKINSETTGVGRVKNSKPHEACLDAHIVSQVSLNLTRGDALSDSLFDRVLPEMARRCSRRQWTPVNVAMRAAELLVQGPRTRVLDVGSGPGKFCVIGALTTEGTFHGVEQRKPFYEIAKKMAVALSVPRVEFIYGNMSDVNWNHYDSFYLFNPFFENIDPSAQIDQTVPMGEMYFRYYVRVVEEKLIELKKGSRVATYHGFGGSFPDTFRRVIRESHGDDYLELWVKESQEKYDKIRGTAMKTRVGSL